LNNLDLFVSGVDVKTQEEVALKLVSEVVMDSSLQLSSDGDG